MAATVFLDRDGVLNRPAARGEYVTSPDQLELMEGAAEAVRMLNEHGLLVLVVTNQRGIALGRMSVLDLERIHAKLRAKLAAEGARLDGIYHCPHPKDTCSCRKPEIGLFMQAQRDHPEIDFGRSVVVGDSMSDIAAARRIGARGMLLSSRRPATCEHAASLLEAASLIVDL